MLAGARLENKSEAKEREQKYPAESRVSSAKLDLMPRPLPLEISGFTEENVTAYIDQFFKQTVPPRPELATSLQQLLTDNVNLRSISHIPIQLEILCNLWGSESETFKANTDELTLSQLYQRLTLSLLKRQMNKDISNALAESSLLRRCRDELAALEQVAFSMMQHQQVVLAGEKLTPLLTRFSEDDPHFIDCLMQLGFLKYLRQDYYFIHLTFQEYFAARHLVVCLQEPPSSQNYQIAFQFINQHKYNCHYKILLGFVAGLLSQQTGEKAMQALKSFWHAIDAEPREWFGTHHLELVLHCLNESVLDKRIPNYEGRLQSLHALIERGIVTVEKHGEVEKYLTLLKTHRRIFYRALMELDSSQMLLKQLTNQNSAIRYKVLEVLHVLGPRLWEHQPVWEAVLKCLDGKESWVRQAALSVFQGSGPQLWEHKPVWEVLLKCLEDNEWQVREATRRVFQAAHPQFWGHQPACKAILKRLEDNNNWVRLTAFEVLKALGPRLCEHQPVLEMMLKHLENKAWMMRQMALEVFQASGPRLWDHQPVLVMVLKCLGDKEQMVRLAALKVFQASGPRLWEHQPAWAAVLKCLEDKEPQMCEAALKVLQASGPRLWEHQPVLVMVLKCLGDKEQMVRLAALKIFQASGPRLWEYKPVLEVALKCLGDKKQVLRETALKVFQASGPRLWEHQPAWAAVLKCLEDKEQEVREAALEVLQAPDLRLWEHQSAWEAVLKRLDVAFAVLKATGPQLWKHQPAWEMVLKCLKDKNEGVREAALKVFQASGPQLWDHQSVWEAVLKCLKDKEYGVYLAALRVFQASGPPRLWVHQPIWKPILKCLESKNEVVRRTALGVFQASGPLWEHRPTWEVVLKCLEDKDKWIRRAALDVLQRIPLLPAFNYVTRPDNPISFEILAKIANLQNVSFYIADQVLWLVDQKGTTRVDLAWDQIQGHLQKLLAACQEFAREQGFSDFMNSALIKKPEADAKQNTNSFFAEDSRKRSRSAEPAASASSSSSANSNAAASLPNFSA